MAAPTTVQSKLIDHYIVAVNIFECCERTTMNRTPNKVSVWPVYKPTELHTPAHIILRKAFDIYENNELEVEHYIALLS